MCVSFSPWWALTMRGSGRAKGGDGRQGWCGDGGGGKRMFMFVFGYEFIWLRVLVKTG
jgi:hypothetical protein